MNKTILAAGTAVLAIFGAATAYAVSGDDAGRKPMTDMTRTELAQKIDARFAKLDTNGDGTITREERDASRVLRQAKRFDSLDADKNGSLSRTEFAAGDHRGGKHRGMDEGRRGHHDRGMSGFDKDAAVTKADFQKRGLERFDRMDANGDGTVTVAEHKAARGKWKGRGD